MIYLPIKILKLPNYLKKIFLSKYIIVIKTSKFTYYPSYYYYSISYLTIFSNLLLITYIIIRNLKWQTPLITTFFSDYYLNYYHYLIFYLITLSKLLLLITQITKINLLAIQFRVLFALQIYSIFYIIWRIFQ